MRHQASAAPSASSEIHIAFAGPIDVQAAQRMFGAFSTAVNAGVRRGRSMCYGLKEPRLMQCLVAFIAISGKA